MSKKNKSILLNYVWLDGYEQQNVRSKIKVVKEKEIKLISELA